MDDFTKSLPRSLPTEEQRFVNIDPSAEEYEDAYIPAEFVSIHLKHGRYGGYVLLQDGTHAKITSFHDDSGEIIDGPEGAVAVCAIVNGLVLAYSVELQKTVH